MEGDVAYKRKVYGSSYADGVHSDSAPELDKRILDLCDMVAKKVLPSFTNYRYEKFILGFDICAGAPMVKKGSCGWMVFYASEKAPWSPGKRYSVHTDNRLGEIAVTPIGTFSGDVLKIPSEEWVIAPFSYDAAKARLRVLPREHRADGIFMKKNLPDEERQEAIRLGRNMMRLAGEALVDFVFASPELAIGSMMCHDWPVTRVDRSIAEVRKEIGTLEDDLRRHGSL